VDHAAALLEQNRLLDELTRDADPDTPVPTCPGWTLRQLLRHVGRGDRWAAQIVRERRDSGLDPRQVEAGKPPDDAEGAREWLRGSPRALVSAIETDPDAPVWTFVGPRPALWWLRRRLHESAVHRADAAIALGLPYDLAPALAADGVSEWLGLLAAGMAPEPALPPDTTVHLHATDDGLGTDGEWMLRGGPDGLDWEHGHGKGDVAVRGRAVDLLLCVLRRGVPAERDVQVLGDEGLWDGWLARTPF
jgi:uncharacterized protein (TIGR03083 family)